MNKNIIFVWTTKPSNLTPTDSWGFWGIGDIIRGIIGTYQIAKKLNYNFYIDIQNHPISKFLEPHYHPFFNDVKDKPIPFIFPNKVETFFIESNQENIYLITNEIYKDEPEIEILNYIKNILTPNKEFSKEFREIFNHLNLKSNYSVIHFRLGDKELIENKLNESYIHKALNLYSNHKEENQLLVSDSLEFRKQLKEKFDFNQYEIKIPAHFGFTNHSYFIKDTLIEFFLLLKSSKIKTYSVNGWVSGFAKSASVINNIPLGIE